MAWNVDIDVLQVVFTCHCTRTNPVGDEFGDIDSYRVRLAVKSRLTAVREVSRNVVVDATE